MQSRKYGSTYFHFNGDLSGKVEIVSAKADGNSVRVPAGALFAFVADCIRDQRIDQLESAEAGEILGCELPEE